MPKKFNRPEFRTIMYKLLGPDSCNKVSLPTHISHSPTVGMIPTMRFAPSVSYPRLLTRCPVGHGVIPTATHKMRCRAWCHYAGLAQGPRGGRGRTSLPWWDARRVCGDGTRAGLVRICGLSEIFFSRQIDCGLHLVLYL